jgi:hypothetical protein
MLKRSLYAAAALAAVAVAGIAAANDSIAEMTAGGLVLKNSRNIDMLDEDLYVSAEQIRVNYVFRNQGRADESVIVAFPMPDRDLSQEGESDISYVRDFVTTVEGRRVQTQVERKAMLAGRDVTAELSRYNVPIAPLMGYQEGVRDPVEAALARLEEDDRRALARRGIIELGDAGEITRYLWIVKETYYWTQTFPAGRELKIQHQYKPGAGGSVGSILSIRSSRGDPEYSKMVRDYCVDQAFLSGAERMTRSGGENAYLPETTIGYILKTGANWRSPIRNFRLVVDKGAPENIVSFCGTGVRKISPTQFEMRRTNWRPTQDLKVVILSPTPLPAPE